MVVTNIGRNNSGVLSVLAVTALLVLLIQTSLMYRGRLKSYTGSQAGNFIDALSVANIIKECHVN